MSTKNVKDEQKKLLGFPLKSKQDVLLNYLIPSLGACALYILIFATEIGLIDRHFKDENVVYGYVTLLIMYLPVIGSYVIIMSSLELWPEMEHCNRKNCYWFLCKTVQHVAFPIWSLWRFAERIFWSIEALRSEDDDDRKYCKGMVYSPRTIELYIFLQAFVHCLPQILFQLHLLMRHTHTTDKQTAHAQFLSIAFNLTKLAMTVTYYQRFKTQKLAGSQYPWYKPHKHQFDQSLNEVTLRRKTAGISMVGAGKTPTHSSDPNEPINRRSSEFYLEPDTRGSSLPPYSSRNPSSISYSPKNRKRLTYLSRTTSSNDSSQPDFNIRRLLYIKGLPEDDLAGKLVAFCWWCAFLLARILAISAFQFFYPSQVLYILVSHFILTLAILCYDAKSDQITRSKAIFFIFVCYIYLFCIIEFKIKFKKTKFVYFGFFTLVYLENLIMCLVWWFGGIESIENDFWFRYTFYIIVMCSICSLSAMVFYFSINKPKKIVVGQVML